MRQTRVVIADDNRAMRDALADVLRSTGDFEVVAELADGHGLVPSVQETGATLVVLDVAMDAGGQVGAAALQALSPAPVVVAVTATDDHETVVGLLEAGVTGYFVKGTLGDGFVDDLLRCARGEVILALPHAGRALQQALAR
ncbi:response regulator [Lapillicoccus jejuensis]|uniref:Response regulator receiver domain-containing protein n=1 Tax=Lapillicoccus jejuensis TaxID=402171 RepID=A0A542DXZ6_9MICO|nr:response regulator [Lapillicoccus jejuensis]TQJ07963.1 response regulator receiver domain-containing protein [Lapillicoccus jejuensis]